MKNKKRRNIDDTLKERTPGEIIAAIRKEHGWTQEELAWHSRISVTQIGRIERNQVMSYDLSLRDPVTKEEFVVPRHMMYGSNIKCDYLDLNGLCSCFD